MRRTTSCWLLVLLVVSLVWPAGQAAAQGVTTSAVTGVVKDAQGAVIPGATVSAVHQPSGSTYEAVTQADGRFTIAGMRIGGPYTITAALSGFRAEAKNDVTLTLGVVQDVSFGLALASVAETVTVTGETSPVFSSTRTGAATSVSRDELAVLPTVSGRINDITRLTPQYGGSGSFAGQDNRMNNITVDGSYFNNSFGLGGQPGDRTGVAPISLEAIEQVQVSVAPFDVRQANFVGAGVNTVTRSGTNRLSASIYHRFRNESFVGTEAQGLAFNPGVFSTTRPAGGPAARSSRTGCLRLAATRSRKTPGRCRRSGRTPAARPPRAASRACSRPTSTRSAPCSRIVSTTRPARTRTSTSSRRPSRSSSRPTTT